MYIILSTRSGFGDEDPEVITAGRYQIALTQNIKARNLSSNFTVAVNGDDLKNVVKALYKYSQEADDYFTD